MFQYDPKELSGEPLADRSNILKSRPNAKSKAGKDGGTQGITATISLLIFSLFMCIIQKSIAGHSIQCVFLESI